MSGSTRGPDMGGEVIERGTDDGRRLWALEALCDPLTISVLGRIGLARDWRCLEIGAGRGSIARWLATQCLHGRVVATDTDIRHLSDLRSPNLHVRRHDVVDGPEMASESFDLVHVRALLVHLPERQAVLARAVTWLAPGGWLVAEEPALFPVDSCLDPDLRLALTAFERLLAGQLGSDFRWPRHLPAALRSEGLVNVNLTAVLAATGKAGAINEFWRVNLTEIGPDLVEAGLVTRDVLTRALAILDDPDHIDLTLAVICAWGQRPPGQPAESPESDTGGDGVPTLRLGLGDWGPR